MSRHKTKAESAHMDRVASLGCLICRRILDTYSAAHLHHVAEGSGLRSNFAVVPLCPEHHTGKQGLHGMGSKAFIRAYRLPGESEYGLLVWLFEELANAALRGYAEEM
jgi:hypothetical protein